MKKNFVTGFIAGGIICAAVTGFAVEYAVTANPYPVKVNGIETTIQGYNINDETYFKLRDISAAVGGFEVGFENNAIIVNIPNKPTPTPTSDDITIVKGEDGNDYTSDGLKIEHTSEGDYVFNWDIKNHLSEKGITEYDFAGKYFFKKGSSENILDDIPVNQDNKLLIPVNYYYNTLKPILDNLKAE